MSKKVELAKVSNHFDTDCDKADDLTVRELSQISLDVVQSVLDNNPLLKSEIEDVFCSVYLGSEWLCSNVPALGGLSPIEAIQNGDLKLVLNTLNKIKYGEYC